MVGATSTFTIIAANIQQFSMLLILKDVTVVSSTAAICSFRWVSPDGYVSHFKNCVHSNSEMKNAHSFHHVRYVRIIVATAAFFFKVVFCFPRGFLGLERTELWTLWIVRFTSMPVFTSLKWATSKCAVAHLYSRRFPYRNKPLKTMQIALQWTTIDLAFRFLARVIIHFDRGSLAREEFPYDASDWVIRIEVDIY